MEESPIPDHADVPDDADSNVVNEISATMSSITGSVAGEDADGSQTEPPNLDLMPLAERLRLQTAAHADTLLEVIDGLREAVTVAVRSSQRLGFDTGTFWAQKLLERTANEHLTTVFASYLPVLEEQNPAVEDLDVVLYLMGQFTDAVQSFQTSLTEALDASVKLENEDQLIKSVQVLERIFALAQPVYRALFIWAADPVLHSFFGLLSFA